MSFPLLRAARAIRLIRLILLHPLTAPREPMKFPLKTSEFTPVLARMVVVLFFAIFATISILSYRNDSHFDYVAIRVNGPELRPEGIVVEAVSPWGSRKELVYRGDGIWVISGKNDSGKRRVSAIEVSGPGLSQSGVGDSWEISRTQWRRASWEKATIEQVTGASGPIALVRPEKGPRQSIFPGANGTINWRGDLSLFLRSGLWTVSFFLIGFSILVSMRVIRSENRSRREHGHPSAPYSKFEKGILWTVLVGVFLFGAIGGIRMTETNWPGLHDDAVMYSTVILNRADGRGNTFDVYSPAIFRQNGVKEFGGHGQLYYSLLAPLLSEPRYGALLKLIHSINLACLLLAVSTAWVFLRREREWSHLACAAASLPFAFATVSVMHYLQGRPEHGIPPVLLSFALLRSLSKRAKEFNFFSGAEIGLVAAISPLPGGILGLGTVFSRGLQPGRKSLWVTASISALAALATWAIVSFFAFHDSPAKLFLSTLPKSNLYLAFEPGAILRFWFRDEFAPGTGFLFALGAVVAAFQFADAIRQKTLPRVVDRLLLATSAVLLVIAAWFLTLSYAGFHYSVLAFLPSLTLWLLRPSVTPLPIALSGSTVKNCSWFWPRLVAPATLIALVAASVGFLRTSAIQPSVAGNSISLSEATAKLEPWRQQLSRDEFMLIESFIARRSAVVYDRPPWKFRSRSVAEDRVDPDSLPLYLIPQWTSEPPRVEGFRLVDDTFSEVPPEPLWGLGFAYTPGYGYALYERSLDEAKSEP